MESPKGLQGVILPFKFEPLPGNDSTTDKPRFRGLAYSGEVFNHGWFEKLGVDLATMHNKSTVRILRNHDFDQEIGEAQLINDGQTLRLENGWLFDHVKESEIVAGILKQGGSYELSIGMTGKTKRYDPPEVRELNGRTQTVEWLVYDGRVFETSFVPAGADENTFVETFSIKLGQPPKETPPKQGEVDMSQEQIDALNAQIKTLSDQMVELAGSNKALQTRNAALEDAAKQATQQAKQLAVQQKLKNVGIELEDSDLELKMYAEMSDEALTAIIARFATSAQTTYLTQHQATGDDAPAKEQPSQLGKYKPTGLTMAINNMIAQQQKKAG